MSFEEALAFVSDTDLSGAIQSRYLHLIRGNHLCQLEASVFCSINVVQFKENCTHACIELVKAPELPHCMLLARSIVKHKCKPKHSLSRDDLTELKYNPGMQFQSEWWHSIGIVVP